MKTNKQKKQQGFTLIELMIVVAVIGVLAAIAMPQYQKYVAKSEVASALATLTGAKTNVEAYTVENGLFPDGSSQDQTTTDLGIPTMPLGSVAFTPSGTGDGGTMAFTFFTTASAGVSSLVSGKGFTLTRADTSGQWTCATATTSGVESELLPKSCK
ncbi:pilin [Vibrio harveyi]|uniref:pilin n=1 Tax=Vibrio harveyi TaxID=669 RepID=UPI003300D743|nr:pilin [Vibrio harveyi]HDM8132645.1 pilin [Vibrio harveyi]HDM8157299.1 pilin [Vibrio harveyi]